MVDQQVEEWKSIRERMAEENLIQKRINKMENNKEKKICAFCGYAADGRFEGDICPQCGLT